MDKFISRIYYNNILYKVLINIIIIIQSNIFNSKISKNIFLLYYITCSIPNWFYFLCDFLINFLFHIFLSAIAISYVKNA